MSGTLLLIGLAVLVGLWRARHRGWRSPALWLQPVAGLLLAATLFPPSVPVDGSTLNVLTPGATAEQRRAVPFLAPVVALLGVDAGGDAVPDLAAALRLHPEASALLILGHGLPPRDLAAVGGRALRFDATPPLGIVALAAPAKAKLGTHWQLSGKVAGPAVKVTLHDPSGAQLDAATPDGEGAFRLAAVARAPGFVQFEVRARDAADRLLDHAAVPLIVEGGERLQVRYRAGSPDADAKYWRRWAQDAGLLVAYRAGLSEGVALSADDAALTAETLAASDLVVMDDRAWAQLSADEKSALLAAVDGGLGLILKTGGPLETSVAADWAALGFATSALDAPPSVTLDRRLAMRERAGFTAAPVALADAPGLTALLRADDGSLLAAWRARGAGRIAVWRLLDSYRLVLSGEGARYGALWSEVVAQLSRPLAASAPGPELPRDAWVDERAVLCRLGNVATLLSPDGVAQKLIVAADGCAAAWPGEPGWHWLQTGADRWPLFVRAVDDGSGLRAVRDRDATRALQGESTVSLPPNPIPIRLPRWPWFIAWLIAVGLLWWRERRSD